jgi:hypothetical protein
MCSILKKNLRKHGFSVLDHQIVSESISIVTKCWPGEISVCNMTSHNLDISYEQTILEVYILFTTIDVAWTLRSIYTYTTARLFDIVSGALTEKHLVNAC